MQTRKRDLNEKLQRIHRLDNFLEPKTLLDVEVLYHVSKWRMPFGLLFFGCSCCRCCCCWWVCCFQCMCSNSFVFLIFFFFDFSHFSQTKIIVFRWCEGISMLVASDFIAPFIVFIKTIENFQHSLIWMQNALYGLPFILNWKRVERQNRRIRRYCVCNSILFNAMWCCTVCIVQLFRLLASLYLTFYDAFPCALCVCCFPFGFFSFCPSFTRSNMYFVMIKIIFSDYRFFLGAWHSA